MKFEAPLPLLSDTDRATYGWQLPVAGFGEDGQRKLKGASVLISRSGGLGGVVAYELAAAGIGRLILAHGGNVKPSDLNRQILMTHDWIGKPRVECAARRLRELNPALEVLAVPENVQESNARRLVAEADVVVDCAPLFEERYLLNREAVRQRKTLIECAVYDLEAQVTTLLLEDGPCLRCLYREPPPTWTRQFPVFGAVSGTVGCLAAMEAIKVLSGLGQPLSGQLLMADLRTMTFRRLNVRRDPDCPECAQRSEDRPARNAVLTLP
jgi:molybdopterin/thiamine biosynthesis adenylyltransferase